LLCNLIALHADTGNKKKSPGQASKIVELHHSEQGENLFVVKPIFIITSQVFGIAAVTQF